MILINILKQILSDDLEREKLNLKEILSKDKINYTKVYFLNDTPRDKKCMISKLEIDFNSDEVLACPFCGNFAKGVLFEKWLTKNTKCPVCLHELSFDECLFVEIKRRKK